MTSEKINLFLVDDDAIFLKALEIQFSEKGKFYVETYSSGELCVQNLDRRPDVIILDYHLDGINKHAMNGIETLDAIKKFYPEIPVVMLSSQDRIEVAVNCMHHQAFDYVVKSETSFMRLQSIIANIFKIQKIQKELKWYMERM
jgi:two-component system OmpR family response regulator